jgi:hypothetical protein
MKSFQQCINCDEFTGGNKFCGKQCKNEYYNAAVMGEVSLNTLSLLAERRGWVRMEYTATVQNMAARNAPMVMVRNADKWNCEAHITPFGERWLRYHTESEAA